MTVLGRATSGFVAPRILFAIALGAGAGACSSTPPHSTPSTETENNASIESSARAVLTQHNDNARTGAMLNETVLNTGNVNVARFGKKASFSVRGSVTAQPLYVPNVSIDGRARKVVYVATMHNFVYAFPAGGASTKPLWGPVSLGPSIPLPDPAIGSGPNYRDIAGEIGIISTPVISLESNALFVVAASKENGRFYHRLHQLDLATGQPLGSPVVIEAPEFVSELQNQRSALLLSNDTLYVAFGAYSDIGAYRGFLFAYDAKTLRFRSVYRTTETEGGQGGIWMAGQGPAADADGNVYAITANGQFTPNELEPLKTSDLSDSFIKLSPELALTSWFSPANNAFLNSEDGDLGASGAMLLPNTKVVLGAGKEGKFFLLDRTNLGYFDSALEDRQAGVLQRFFATPTRCNDRLWTSNCHHVHGSPVYWDGPKGAWIYVWPENDYLKAFLFDPKTQRVDCRGEVDPECGPISESTTRDPENVPGGSHGMPGGFLSLSANDKTKGSGILWGLHPYTGDANQAVVAGILRAYDASDLTRELWNSRMNPGRDDVGKYAKTAAPTIADGSVYVPSFTDLSNQTTLEKQSEISVYGLL